jgi:hypothetical protein
VVELQAFLHMRMGRVRNPNLANEEMQPGKQEALPAALRPRPRIRNKVNYSARLSKKKESAGESLFAYEHRNVTGLPTLALSRVGPNLVMSRSKIAWHFVPAFVCCKYWHSYTAL